MDRRKMLTAAGLGSAGALMGSATTEAAAHDEGFKYRHLDKNNVAVLLVDHQTGLTALVQDFSPDDF